MKKIFLPICLLFYSHAHPLSVYSLLDTFGYCTDIILSKGKLSDKHEKMFVEIAKKLGIENRDIKARNSGLLLRLMAGFNNALAVQQTNRVYLNQTCLNEMDDEEIKFLMAHELSHHAKNHIWKRMAAAIALDIASNSINFNCQKPIKNFFEPSIGHIPMGRYIFNKSLATFTIWNLIFAQLCQYQETEADSCAVLQAGVCPQNGVTLLTRLYYPQTESWPLYGKVINIINQLTMPIVSLPIIKEFMPHLTSYTDRAKKLIDLEPEWYQKYSALYLKTHLK